MKNYPRSMDDIVQYIIGAVMLNHRGGNVTMSYKSGVFKGEIIAVELENLISITVAWLAPATEFRDKLAKMVNDVVNSVNERYQNTFRLTDAAKLLGTINE